MELLSNLWLGLQVASEPITLLYCFGGVLLGTVVGVLPGIGALAAISLLLPLTYHMPPTSAIIMLAGVMSLGRMNVDIFPPIDIPVVMVA